MSTTAQAQNPDDRYAQDRDRYDQNQRGRNWDRYGNYGGSVELRQTALNAGYNEGVREANSDRQSYRQANYRDSTSYKRATTDYSRRLGDRGLYQRYFREAFENGYNDYDQTNIGRDDRYPNRYPNDNGDRNRRGRNWDGYGNFGGSFQLRQTALNAGYNEGTKQGHNDRNKNRRSDYRNSSAYQKATSDYSSKLGDRELYRRYYREGFGTGYSDGYNGY